MHRRPRMLYGGNKVEACRKTLQKEQTPFSAFGTLLSDLDYYSDILVERVLELTKGAVISGPAIRYLPWCKLSQDGQAGPKTPV